MFNTILVVCVGNICRSPMAAAWLTEKYAQKHIESAGLSALVGYHADATAQEVMRAEGLEISKHIAKQINEQLVMSADLILTMSSNQTKWLERQWPHCRGKTFRIGHWINKDIADPYQHDRAVFETTKKDIVDSLEAWNKKIS
ncbi:low molecular weight protein-tyrosine-phosphatase [Psychrobacter sp. 1U2]|uniref:low molecular weight protein-tyrosine-phosphatase n=1 Tax=Psychrobacter sp. 1U2 TaxID=3453577 RepID=UPI003F48F3B8